MQWKTCNGNMVLSVFNSHSIQKTLLEPGALSNCYEHCPIIPHESFENTSDRADCFPTLWHVLKPAFWNRSDSAHTSPFMPIYTHIYTYIWMYINFMTERLLSKGLIKDFQWVWFFYCITYILTYIHFFSVGFSCPSGFKLLKLKCLFHNSSTQGPPAQSPWLFDLWCVIAVRELCRTKFMSACLCSAFIVAFLLNVLVVICFPCPCLTLAIANVIDYRACAGKQWNESSQFWWHHPKTAETSWL